MATTSVTVLGTGLMGAGTARSLARAGHDVTVWNRTPDKAPLLAGEDGIKVVENLHEALGGADFILTMLFDADAVTEVMRDALPNAPRHTVWVQTSDERDGELIVLAAGDAALRDRVAPVFDAIGSRTIWAGEQAGDGHRLKLVANSWVLSVTGATAQSIGFAQRLGVDPQLFLDAIAGGPPDCGHAQVKAEAMLEGNFTPPFGLGCHGGHGEDHDKDDMAAVVLAFTR